MIERDDEFSVSDGGVRNGGAEDCPYQGRLYGVRRFAVVIATVLMGISAHASLAGDWPSWRGPMQNGMAYEKAVVTKWSQDGENLLWKAPIVGRSTPILMDGRLFFIAPAGKGECLGERVVCLDADTGTLQWEHRFNVFLSTIVENRLGWTAVCGDPETKYVYAHGTGGLLFCFDRDGNVVWKRSLTEMYGRVSGYGGRLHTPIVDEDKVIISFVSSNWGSHGKPGHRYVAFDKKTGDVIWWALPGGKPLDTTYSVPVVTVLNGVRMMIAANADGNVYGMKVRTGERIWSFKLAKRGINSSVVMNGKYAYVTHSEENLSTTEMGSVVCLDASLTGDITETGVVWRRDGITAGYASPAIVHGRLYVANNASNLYCFDAKSGKTLWEYRMGRVTKGSPTVTADGVIYVATVNGRFLILKDADDYCEALDIEEFKAADGSIVEIYGCPIVADGRVYFMNRSNTYCLGTKDAKVETVAMPSMAKEADPDPSKRAKMLVRPGEITVAPGGQAQFSFQFFDSNGRAIKQSDDQRITTAVKGVLGTMGSGGLFAASSDPSFSAGVIEVKIGDLTGTARVRISPQLPIKENFDGLKGKRNPPGWVGLGAKAKLLEFEDGNIVLEKLARKEKPSVPFMRMRAYSGPPIPVGYTVQCDVMGRPRVRGRPVRPDMGLINSRYLLKLMGQEKTLRLVTWSPIPRLRNEVPFDWKTDVWYQTKLRVEIKDGKALVRGKAWPRGEAEPAGWQIEMTDPCPNTEGSPGLYAYSNGTKSKKVGPPVYFDNYKVYQNEIEN